MTLVVLSASSQQTRARGRGPPPPRRRRGLTEQSKKASDAGVCCKALGTFLTCREMHYIHASTSTCPCFFPTGSLAWHSDHPGDAATPAVSHPRRPAMPAGAAAESAGRRRRRAHDRNGRAA